MKDALGNHLKLGTKVVFVANANTSPYIQIGTISNIYGDECTIQCEKKTHPHIYGFRILTLRGFGNSMLLEYLLQYAKQHDWEEEQVPEQMRAMFTTWCFTSNVNADTSKCDNTLHFLYENMELESVITYDDFENFMVVFIV